MLASGRHPPHRDLSGEGCAPVIIRTELPENDNISIAVMADIEELIAVQGETPECGTAAPAVGQMCAA